MLARDLGYLGLEEYSGMYVSLLEIRRMLHGLRKKLLAPK